MSFLDELNTEQKEAAEALLGPLLIVAGAGSGKTRTLTYRIANLIHQGFARPWQILAVTFTNKAAGEMKRRVENLLQSQWGEENGEPLIGTFHSVCVRILRKHFNRFGREKSFVIYDATDTEGIIKRIFKEKHIEEEDLSPRTVLAIISGAKNKMQTPADLARHAVKAFDRRVAELYADYENTLARNNALDFDDLLIYTVNLFKNHADVLEEYQERWRFIHVDEYQDTNHVQYQLTRMLAAKYRNLCVIGDSDQSIYSFRGADIRNILDFEKDYPEARLIKLEQNYRSTQVILDAADAVIEKNRDRKPKKMWTEQKGGDPVEVWHAQNEYDEAEKIAKEIRRLHEEGEAELRQIVVLYRTNAQSRLIEENLLRYGLPYRVIGGVKFYARKEIKDLLAYLRLIANPGDSESLRRVINVPPRKIGATTLQKLMAFALERSLSLNEVMNHIEMISELAGGAQGALKKFWGFVTAWKTRAEKLTVSALIKEVVRDIEYKAYLQDGTEEGEMRYENILELISVAEKYDGLPSEVALQSFLEEVALVADTDQIDANADAMTLMTLHSVKGLEYSYVFIAGCEENIFPHSRSLFDQTQMEEERRLMYVGITRAMKKLYLLAAKQRTLYGTPQTNALSRFIKDIPEDLTRKVGVRESVFAPARPRQTAEERFKDGDRVRHGTFGEGIVVERRGDLITIAFQNKLYGLKKFAANIAPLEKVE